MLKKLLKYDLKGMFKFLIIFYSLSLFFGLLTRIFLSVENSFIINVIGQICGGVTISMIFNILINNLIRLGVKFKNNFYGDESYLIHTLPVDKKNLYLSKMITAIITLFTSMLVIGVTIFIAYYSKENYLILKNMLLSIADLYDSSVIKILLEFLFIFFLEIACALQAGFTGIILGHKMNNLKVGYSVLFALATYIITQIFVLIIVFVFALFNGDIMNLFFTNETVSMDVLNVIIHLVIIIYSITLFIGYFVNLKLFKKGVNVD